MKKKNYTIYNKLVKILIKHLLRKYFKNSFYLEIYFKDLFIGIS